MTQAGCRAGTGPPAGQGRGWRGEAWSWEVGRELQRLRLEARNWEPSAVEKPRVGGSWDAGAGRGGEDGDQGQGGPSLCGHAWPPGLLRRWAPLRLPLQSRSALLYGMVFPQL